MPIKTIFPTSFYACVSREDIVTNDLTDHEFRLYCYYRSHSTQYGISIPKTAKALQKSVKTIRELNKKLIAKGYLAIRGNRDPVYHVGVDEVEMAYKKHKEYFKYKKERNTKHSELMKEKSKFKSKDEADISP